MNKSNQKQVVLTLTIAYTALMIYLMLFGFERITYSGHACNFVPFRNIHYFFKIYFGCVENMPEMEKSAFWLFAVNIFGNIGMFIPFGILLPILFNGSFKKAFLVFTTGIITLETAQLISRRGMFDVDDILLNTIGFLTGYAIIKLYNQQHNQRSRAHN